MNSSPDRKANHLAHETSPYLLQHAYNPVDWYPWGEEALAKAKREDKLMLVSIGYSACHWCHVMERESFEDDSVAEIMNAHFLCIKVDREERPDIDQVYMHAVQLMTGGGGWPLNCFALPDGRPVFGGTYFPKEEWKRVLLQLAGVYKNEKQKAVEYAEQLTKGVQQMELVKRNAGKPEFSKEILAQMVGEWSKRFDNKEGGPMKAPKFPLPNNYSFLLRYYYHTRDPGLLNHIRLSLDKMAFGGIYDQVGGGFARYSTDSKWKVPHFEKMLYDNAQLVSLYSEAYQLMKDPLYREIVYETLEFIEREMTSPEGAFYSALDADSEGEEGKYYVWKKEELQKILGKDFDLFAEYFNVNATGSWEHGNYILLRTRPDAEIAKERNMRLEDLQLKVQEMKRKVLEQRGKRVRPALDDKSLTSWNALMIKGYCDAYEAFGEKKFLSAAERNAALILKKQKRSDGGLNRNYKNGRSTINGFLEDYSFTIQAFLALYECTFDEQWLREARRLADHSIAHFRDSSSGMFWFTSDLDTALIARKMEVMDNVVPSSNSSMAESLFLLGAHFDNPDYTAMSRQMLHNVQGEMPSYGSGYSNWGLLHVNFTYPFYEVAIVGNSVDEKRSEFSGHYLPNRIFAGSRSPSSLPLLENKFAVGKTLVYVCENRLCKRPVAEVSEALQQIGH